MLEMFDPLALDRERLVTTIQPVGVHTKLGNRLGYVLFSNQQSQVATQTVSGAISVGEALPESTIAILLHETTGTIVRTIKVPPENGVFNIEGVEPGNYALVVLDRTGSKRAKVMHTVVP